MDDTSVGLSGEIDTNTPHIARIYDYLLGGAHNFASDRLMADMIERTMPHVRDVARLNRAFLRRAVRFMMANGVRQFLDIGSGIPTVGNVHEIAQAADPGARVVYVDKEQVAVVHSRLLLEGNDRAAAIQADIRTPEHIIGHPETRRLLNFEEPVGVLMLLVWHFVPDADDPLGLLARYRDALTPGSYLAMTHLGDDDRPESVTKIVEEAKRRGMGDTTPRTREAFAKMFAGFELLEPGVVGCAEWRPDGPGDFSPESAANEVFYAGIGRRSEARESG